jgi:epoxyqueuosine reductase
VLARLRVRAPVRSGIAKWVYRYISQTTCPWNVKYATLLPAGSPFAPREALAGKDAPQLARELLGMSQDEFVGAFKGSPMKRAKLRGLKRNAAVVLGNVGTPDDAGVLRQALEDSEPLVREHAEWALDRISERAARTR